MLEEEDGWVDGWVWVEEWLVGWEVVGVGGLLDKGQGVKT